jgi:hypothetical protein
MVSESQRRMEYVISHKKDPHSWHSAPCGIQLTTQPNYADSLPFFDDSKHFHNSEILPE